MPSAGPQRLRAAFWWLALLILLAAMLGRPLNLLLTEPAAVQRVVDYLVDDAYYYLGIAANLAEYGESTLDGDTRTNGYQPLWLLMLAGLAAVVGTDPWPLFVATSVLIAAIAVLSVALALRWRRTPSAGVAFVAAAGLAIAVLQYPTVFLTGMEPIVALLAFVPMLVLIESPAAQRHLVALSALLAWLFLARIDGLVLSASVALLLIAERGPPARLLRLFSIVVPVALAYFANNQWLFASPVPVSGLAKNIGAPALANWGVLEYAIGAKRPLQVMAGFWLLLEFACWRRGCWTPTFLKSLLVWVTAAIVQSLYYAAFSAWLIWPWYIWLSALSFAVLVARIAHLAFSLIAAKRDQWLAALVLIALLATETDKARSYLRRPIADLKASLRQGPVAIPDTALSFNQLSLEMLDSGFFFAYPRVAMGDRAGRLAYWGRRQLSLVQTEGLTLDAAYLLARKVGKAEHWFETRFALRYWIVDRGHLPMLRDAGGGIEYVIADPIQGRVNLDPPPTFCFGHDTLEYQRSYGAAPTGGTRYVFTFAGRRPCSPAARALIAEAAAGAGLRQLSLPAEYDIVPKGFLYTADEDRDRRIARQRRGTGGP